MQKIVQKEDPILRKTADQVPIHKITGWKIKNVVKRMRKALNSRSDGVAIAAPQIGVSLRIFIISEKIFSETDTDIHTVFINPHIIAASETTEQMHEGCLSVANLYGNVARHTNVTIEAYDEHGEKFIAEGHGLLAQIFQHETDHLNGILFIDKASELEPIPNNEY